MSTNAGGKADDDDSRLERDEPVAATKVSLGVGGLGSRLSARHLADDYLESEARLGPVKTLPGLGTSSCPSRSLPAGKRRRSRSRSLMAACGPTPWSTLRARTPPSSSARRAPPLPVGPPPMLFPGSRTRPSSSRGARRTTPAAARPRSTSWSTRLLGIVPHDKLWVGKHGL